jgi:hypothetical protein
VHISLDLPEELVREMSAEAAQLGLPLADYIRRVLATRRTAGQMPKTGADLVAYWQTEGLIGCRPDITDSQQHARKLRAQSARVGLHPQRE